MSAEGPRGGLPQLPDRYTDYSFGLHRDHTVRRLAFAVSRSSWFERGASLLILANSVILALTVFGCFDRAGAPVSERRVVTEAEAPGAAVAAGCSSWYLNEAGENFSIWPGTTLAYLARMARFDLENYLLTEPGAAE